MLKFSPKILIVYIRKYTFSIVYIRKYTFLIYPFRWKPQVKPIHFSCSITITIKNCYINGRVPVISRKPPFEARHVWNTTVPFTQLFKQQRGRNCRFSIWKKYIILSLNRGPPQFLILRAKPLKLKPQKKLRQYNWWDPYKFPTPSCAITGLPFKILLLTVILKEIKPPFEAGRVWYSTVLVTHLF